MSVCTKTNNFIGYLFVCSWEHWKDSTMSESFGKSDWNIKTVIKIKNKNYYKTQKFSFFMHRLSFSYILSLRKMPTCILWAEFWSLQRLKVDKRESIPVSVIFIKLKVLIEFKALYHGATSIAECWEPEVGGIWRHEELQDIARHVQLIEGFLQTLWLGKRCEDHDN